MFQSPILRTHFNCNLLNTVVETALNINLFFVRFILQQVVKFTDEILGYVDQTTNWAVKIVRINLFQELLLTTLVIL